MTQNWKLLSQAMPAHIGLVRVSYIKCTQSKIYEHYYFRPRLLVQIVLYIVELALGFTSNRNTHSSTSLTPLQRCSQCILLLTCLVTCLFQCYSRNE